MKFVAAFFLNLIVLIGLLLYLFISGTFKVQDFQSFKISEVKQLEDSLKDCQEKTDLTIDDLKKMLEEKSKKLDADLKVLNQNQLTINDKIEKLQEKCDLKCIPVVKKKEEPKVVKTVVKRYIYEPSKDSICLKKWYDYSNKCKPKKGEHEVKPIAVVGDDLDDFQVFEESIKVFKCLSKQEFMNKCLKQ